MSKIISGLKPYIPAAALPYLAELIQHASIKFIITKPRNSKLGDFKSVNGNAVSISVNGNLNPYSFLITSIHELAHLHVFKRFKNKVSPHGKEWKSEFSHLMQPVLNSEVFPDEILQPLKKHMLNPKASSVSDTSLMMALKKYDKINEDEVLLHEVPLGTKFELNGRWFVKDKKLRKHFLCLCAITGRQYRVNALAPIHI